MKNEEMNITDKMNLEFDHVKHEIKEILNNQKGLESSNRLIASKLGVKFEDLVNEFLNQSKENSKESAKRPSMMASNPTTDRKNKQSLDFFGKSIFDEDIADVLNESN